MKYFSPHLARRILAFVIIGAFLAVLYISNPSFLKAPKVESAIADNVSGWALSDTIGWISFNNTSDLNANSYGVKVSATGNFSGFAWSDNIGWISFNRGSTSNPPEDPFKVGSGSDPIAKVDLSTGKVTGWARALSGCQTTSGVPVASCSSSGAGAASGGWDGWIKLSDDINAWGVSVNVYTGVFSGFAWGGASVDASGNSILGDVSVIGWISFNNTSDGSTIPYNVTISPPFKCTLGNGVCAGTQVCLLLSGTCIEPDGSCSTDSDCGGGQFCKDETCRDPGYCTIPTDCVSGICNLSTNTCADSNGAGCGDYTCESGETLLICPQDCKGKVKQF